MLHGVDTTPSTYELGGHHMTIASNCTKDHYYCWIGALQDCTGHGRVLNVLKMIQKLWTSLSPGGHSVRMVSCHLW